MKSKFLAGLFALLSAGCDKSPGPSEADAYYAATWHRSHPNEILLIPQLGGHRGYMPNGESFDAVLKPNWGSTLIYDQEGKLRGVQYMKVYILKEYPDFATAFDHAETGEQIVFDNDGKIVPAEIKK